MNWCLADGRCTSAHLEVNKMQYRLWISTICYGSATIEADSVDDAVKKFYKDTPQISYHGEEISDVVAEPLETIKQEEK